MNFENLNFRGNYKSYDENGKAIVYSKGDVVNYHGKTYVANDTITDSAPTQFGWTFIGGGIQYYSGDSAPQAANVGDEWLNTSSGKFYKYIDDGNSLQWVNIY